MASGKAMMTPPTVPKIARSMVSSAGHHTMSIFPKSGGIAPHDVGHTVRAGDQILRPGADDDRSLCNNRKQHQNEDEA
jgi:hypothetical protein